MQVNLNKGNTIKGVTVRKNQMLRDYVSVTVKVQLSLYSGSGKRNMLVYSEDRELFGEFEATPDVIKWMGNRNKAYAKAHHHTASNTIDIIERVDAQGW